MNGIQDWTQLTFLFLFQDTAAEDLSRTVAVNLDSL